MNLNLDPNTDAFILIKFEKPNSTVFDVFPVNVSAFTLMMAGHALIWQAQQTLGNLSADISKKIQVPEQKVLRAD